MARRVTLVGADMLLVYYLRPVEFQLAFQLADMSHILLLSLLLLLLLLVLIILLILLLLVLLLLVLLRILVSLLQDGVPEGELGRSKNAPRSTVLESR